MAPELLIGALGSLRGTIDRSGGHGVDILQGPSDGLCNGCGITLWLNALQRANSRLVLLGATLHESLRVLRLLLSLKRTEAHVAGELKRRRPRARHYLARCGVQRRLDVTNVLRSRCQRPAGELLAA